MALSLRQHLGFDGLLGIVMSAYPGAAKTDASVRLEGGWSMMDGRIEENNEEKDSEKLFSSLYRRVGRIA